MKNNLTHTSWKWRLSHDLTFSNCHEVQNIQPSSNNCNFCRQKISNKGDKLYSLTFKKAKGCINLETLSV